MRTTTYSYRFADEVLGGATLTGARDEALAILKNLPPIPYGQKPWSKKSPPRYGSEHPIEQAAMNRWVESKFDAHGWEVHPAIVEGSNLEADFRKNRIQVEVQFGNMARWTYDVFKFQVSYSQDQIDVGILAVAQQRFCPYINSNVAQYERIVRELPHAKLSLTLPILVVGLEPEDYATLPPRKQRR